MAQLVPNTEATLPQPPRKTVDALIVLMEKIGPSILMVHSQSGVYGALTAVARPDSGQRSCQRRRPNRLRSGPEQIKIIAKVPMLVVAGDHEWNGEEHCRKIVAAINTAGGKSTFMGTYEQGVRGNTHMMMMDPNNLQVADWILAWVEKNVPKKSWR